MVIDHSSLESALREVMDPHFNVSLHDMGMIRGIDARDDGKVQVTMTFPCIGCPAWTLIHNDIKSALKAVDGVEDVAVKVDWDQEWTRDDMSKKARELAGNHGYRI